jgi:Tfp pilus assembly protein PilF
LRLAGSALLVLATFLVYWPALDGGFLFDDDSMVTRSALVQASDGLRRMWLTADPIDYWPLTNSSLWLEWRLWGMDPTGYHVTNVLLHAGSALLLWAILRRLSIPGAWLAGMLFALHPVNVQSVAWIAQRKNTLSMVFFLLSIAAFLRQQEAGRRGGLEERSAAERPREGRKSRAAPRGLQASTPPRLQASTPPRLVWYFLSLLAFLLAMLSKGSVAILPGVLLLLIWWERGRITREDLVKIAPFVAIAVGLTLVNVWFQARMPGGTRDVTVLERLLGAAGVIWFYLGKALAPVHLTFIYPQWDVRADEIRWWLPLASAVAVTGVLFRQRHRPMARAALFAWTFFCLALVPVMGLTDVYFMKYSLVADHYAYIASIAVVTCIGAAIGVWFRGSGVPGFRGSGVLRFLVPAAFVVVLGLLAWQRAQAFAAPETFYRAALERNPSSWVLHNNLGALLLEQSRNEEGARHLREALRLQPETPQAHNNLCDAAARLGEMDEALRQCSASVRLSPDRAASRNGLGIALASHGRYEEARQQFEAALALDPSSVDAHLNLADLHRAAGRPAEAAEYYRRVLGGRPDSAWAHNGYGAVLADLGDPENAEAAFREAMRLNPTFAEPYQNLADLMVELGRFDEAAAQYRQALAQDPGLAGAHNNLGVVLVRLGRPVEAVQHFRAALEIDPGFPGARANLERVTGGSDGPLR